MVWYAIVLIVVACLIGVYILLCAIIAPRALKEVITPKSRTYEDSRQFQIEKENWDYDNFDNKWDKSPLEIVSFDNVKLRGWYINNPVQKTAKRKKVAIICHGHICNLMQSVKYADIFYNLGYNVIVYDNRYFGESEGYLCSLGLWEAKDLSLIIANAKEVYGEDCFLALHGESMGATTVLSVLETNDNDVDLVVADCPFADAIQLFKEVNRKKHLPIFPTVQFVNILSRGRQGINFRHISPKKSIAFSNTPICYIHGTADRFIDMRHSQLLYKRTKNTDSELHLFEGAFHARSHMLDAKKYIEIVNKFVTKIEKENNINESNAN